MFWSGVAFVCSPALLIKVHSLYSFRRIEKVGVIQYFITLHVSAVMPVQPSVRESEEEMEAGKESQLPETNGELEQRRESERGGEETMDESTEDRESDLDESEEQEEEESSGKSV